MFVLNFLILVLFFCDTSQFSNFKNNLPTGIETIMISDLIHKLSELNLASNVIGFVADARMSCVNIDLDLSDLKAGVALDKIINSLTINNKTTEYEFFVAEYKLIREEFINRVSAEADRFKYWIQERNTPKNPAITVPFELTVYSGQTADLLPDTFDNLTEKVDPDQISNWSRKKRHFYRLGPLISQQNIPRLVNARLPKFQAFMRGEGRSSPVGALTFSSYDYNENLPKYVKTEMLKVAESVFILRNVTMNETMSTRSYFFLKTVQRNYLEILSEALYSLFSGSVHPSLGNLFLEIVAEDMKEKFAESIIAYSGPLAYELLTVAIIGMTRDTIHTRMCYPSYSVEDIGYLLEVHDIGKIYSNCYSYYSFPQFFMMKKTDQNINQLTEVDIVKCKKYGLIHQCMVDQTDKPCFIDGNCPIKEVKLSKEKETVFRPMEYSAIVATLAPRAYYFHANSKKKAEKSLSSNVFIATIPKGASLSIGELEIYSRMSQEDQKELDIKVITPKEDRGYSDSSSTLQGNMVTGLISIVVTIYSTVVSMIVVLKKIKQINADLSKLKKEVHDLDL